MKNDNYYNSNFAASNLLSDTAIHKVLNKTGLYFDKLVGLANKHAELRKEHEDNDIIKWNFVTDIFNGYKEYGFDTFKEFEKEILMPIDATDIKFKQVGNKTDHNIRYVVHINPTMLSGNDNNTLIGTNERLYVLSHRNKTHILIDFDIIGLLNNISKYFNSELTEREKELQKLKENFENTILIFYLVQAYRISTNRNTISGIETEEMFRLINTISKNTDLVKKYMTIDSSFRYRKEDLFLLGRVNMHIKGLLLDIIGGIERHELMLAGTTSQADISNLAIGVNKGYDVLQEFNNYNQQRKIDDNDTKYKKDVLFLRLTDLFYGVLSLHSCISSKTIKEENLSNVLSYSYTLYKDPDINKRLQKIKEVDINKYVTEGNSDPILAFVKNTKNVLMVVCNKLAQLAIINDDFVSRGDDPKRREYYEITIKKNFIDFIDSVKNKLFNLFENNHNYYDVLSNIIFGYQSEKYIQLIADIVESDNSTEIYNNESSEIQYLIALKDEFDSTSTIKKYLTDLLTRISGLTSRISLNYKKNIISEIKQHILHIDTILDSYRNKSNYPTAKTYIREKLNNNMKMGFEDFEGNNPTIALETTLNMLEYYQNKERNYAEEKEYISMCNFIEKFDTAKMPDKLKNRVYKVFRNEANVG